MPIEMVDLSQVFFKRLENHSDGQKRYVRFYYKSVILHSLVIGNLSSEMSVDLFIQYFVTNL